MAAPRPWTVVVTPNADTLVPVKAAVAGRTHVVTKIVFGVGTHVNAKAVFVQDSADTPVVLATFRDLTKAAGVEDNFEVNYSDVKTSGGFPCTAGKAVNVLGESAGHTTGKVLVQGYTI